MRDAARGVVDGGKARCLVRVKQGVLSQSRLSKLVSFMCVECKLTTFGENLEGGNPAAEVGVGSMDVGRKAEPELDLHLGDILKLEPRQLGPGLVGVSVVIEELVSEHEGSDEQAELAAILTSQTRVLGLESVNVEQSKDDDREESSSSQSQMPINRCDRAKTNK